mmetsp:Transcript_31620/g.66506  ORF Transcript_31620/g.66506 Transcript_31620/m.66506 type:complete len:186 (+) Transcript_31620:143-700(+)
MLATTILLFLGTCCHQSAAFLPPSSIAGRTSVTCNHAVQTSQDIVGSDGGSAPTSRRFFMEDVLKGSIGMSLAYISSSPAHASGGATAGGAYLLSAKQRYNKRVIAGVKSFLTLDARDLGQVNAFFASSEEGGWEDVSAAGCKYLIITISFANNLIQLFTAISRIHTYSYYFTIISPIHILIIFI